VPVPVEATAHFVRSVPGQLCEVPDLKIVQGTMRYVSVWGIAENDLLRTKLSCGHMIRLLAHSAPPSPGRQQVVSLSQSSCVPPVELHYY
jgi:hypothetical protein